MSPEDKYNALRDLDDFILSLNEESNRNSIVIVEGKKDVDALFFLGYSGNIKAYHHFRGTTHFLDCFSYRYRKIILLLDSDRKGSNITKKILLQSNGKFIDLDYKKKLLKITRGRIKKIEEIKSFYKSLSEK